MISNSEFFWQVIYRIGSSSQRPESFGVGHLVSHLLNLFPLTHPTLGSTFCIPDATLSGRWMYDSNTVHKSRTSPQPLTFSNSDHTDLRSRNSKYTHLLAFIFLHSSTHLPSLEIRWNSWNSQSKPTPALKSDRTHITRRLSFLSKSLDDVVGTLDQAFVSPLL
jgi:hypothetical protein